MEVIKNERKNEISDQLMKYLTEKYINEEYNSNIKKYMEMISENLNFGNDQINKLLNNQNKSDEISQKLGVQYYRYIAEPQQLNETSEKFNNDISCLLMGYSNKKEKSFQGNFSTTADAINEFRQEYIKDAILVQKLKTVNYKMNEIATILNEDFSGIEYLQENSIKKGIYDKFESIKADVDYKKIEDEYIEIANIGFFKRIFDSLTGRKYHNMEKMENLISIMNSIQHKKDSIQFGSEPNEFSKYSIHKLLGAMQIFMDENTQNPDFVDKYGMQIEEIGKLKNGIETNFAIDPNKIEEYIKEKNKCKLPMALKDNKKFNCKDIIGKFFGQKREEEFSDMKADTDEFLEKNGYLPLWRLNEKNSEIDNKNKGVLNINSEPQINKYTIGLNNLCHKMNDVSQYIGLYNN